MKIDLSSAIMLLRHVKTKSFKKGEVLIAEGSTDKDLFFIRKGLIRSYYINEAVEEKTFQLHPEHTVILNLHAVLFDEPSKFIYQAIEDTKAYSIEYTTLINLTVKNPKLQAMNRELLGRKAMRVAFQRVESFVFLSPEERYVQYVKAHPNLVNRAPDKYIANVLGITPVSLSRIRGRMAAKK